MERFSRFSKKEANTPSQPEKPIVLVIDDDLGIRNALEFRLNTKYQVRLAANGEEGISKMDDTVSVIILDIKMPGKDGLQVYQEIKADHSQVPIIFYSAFQDLLESVSLRRQYKPFGYFDKSGDAQELLAKVDEAINFHDRFSRLREATAKLKSRREVGK